MFCLACRQSICHLCRSQSTCSSGAVRAGRCSPRRFKLYESSSSVAFALLSRSTQCTRCRGLQSWRRARSKTHHPKTVDLRRARWIEKLSCMDFTRCPRLLFGCWLLHGRAHHRDSKPLKTIGHSHTDSLKRIGEASFLEDGAAATAPFVKKAGSITVTPRICPLFQLVQSEAWPSMMEKHVGLD